MIKFFSLETLAWWFAKAVGIARKAEWDKILTYIVVVDGLHDENGALTGREKQARAMKFICDLVPDSVLPDSAVQTLAQVAYWVARRAGWLGRAEDKGKDSAAQGGDQSGEA